MREIKVTKRAGKIDGGLVEFSEFRREVGCLDISHHAILAICFFAPGFASFRPRQKGSGVPLKMAS